MEFPDYSDLYHIVMKVWVALELFYEFVPTWQYNLSGYVGWTGCNNKMMWDNNLSLTK